MLQISRRRHRNVHRFGVLTVDGGRRKQNSDAQDHQLYDLHDLPSCNWFSREVPKIIARLQVSNTAAAASHLTYAIPNCSYIISTCDSRVKNGSLETH